MIRVVVFLIALALIATGVVWFADRPGDVVLTWMGYRIETSMMVAALALVILVIALMLAWSIIRAVLRSPEQVSLFFRHRRAMKGYHAISRGLIAIGAGDRKLARRAADDAARLSPQDPLTLLLNAQAAQLTGDAAAPPNAPSATWRGATKRSSSACAGSISKRSGATIPQPRAASPKKLRPPRPV